MKKINLNSTIKVKLTPFGVDVYYRRYDKLNKLIEIVGGEPIKSTMPRIDKDGFTSLQLHYFMEIFGEYFTIGCRKNVIEGLSIYIEDEDAEEVGCL